MVHKKDRKVFMRRAKCNGKKRAGKLNILESMSPAESKGGVGIQEGALLSSYPSPSQRGWAGGPGRKGGDRREIWEGRFQYSKGANSTSEKKVPEKEGKIFSSLGIQQ